MWFFLSDMINEAVDEVDEQNPCISFVEMIETSQDTDRSWWDV